MGRGKDLAEGEKVLVIEENKSIKYNQINQYIK